jgi:hypothetical protein
MQDPLKKLKDLRIVHFYQSYFTFDQERYKCNCTDVVSHLQHFATLFFQQLHLHCPQLQVLVWGLWGDLDAPISPGDETQACVPIRQHLFVKQTMILPNGEVQISAVSVSRIWLKHEHPDLDILRRDPGLCRTDSYTHIYEC